VSASPLLSGWCVDILDFRVMFWLSCSSRTRFGRTSGPACRGRPATLPAPLLLLLQVFPDHHPLAAGRAGAPDPGPEVIAAEHSRAADLQPLGVQAGRTHPVPGRQAEAAVTCRRLALQQQRMGPGATPAGRGG